MGELKTVEEIIQVLMDNKVKGYVCDSCGGRLVVDDFGYSCEDCWNFQFWEMP